jgi:peptide/nickel transport system permease protein
MRVLLRRLGFYLIAGIAAITIDFMIPRLMPGNAVDAILAQNQGMVTNPATMRSLDLLYGVHDSQPLIVQYGHFWAQIFQGNLGVSTSSYPSQVTTVIAAALPWTVGLVGLATILSFILGTLLGTLIAWRRGTWLDSLLPATTFLQAAPYFFLAFLAVEIFATKLGWFPAELGQSQLDFLPGWSLGHIRDVLYHALLPAATIVVASAAGWVLGMRNQTLAAMDEDYVLMARAKGLPAWRVIWYAARNAILPSVSGLSLAIGFVVSGALLTEIVFSYPGIGFLLYKAVTNHDAPLMQGIFLIITLAVLSANLLADVAYTLLDPRIRREA